MTSSLVRYKAGLVAQMFSLRPDAGDFCMIAANNARNGDLHRFF